jgi:hypothetical protein
MKCKCGFKFSGPGEFRNCDAFITDKGESGVTCPKCQTNYVNDRKISLKRVNKKKA